MISCCQDEFYPACSHENFNTFICFFGEIFKLMMLMIIVEWSHVRFRTPGPGQRTVRLVRCLYSNQEIILIMQLKRSNRRVLDKHKAVQCKSRPTLNLTLKALKTFLSVSTCYERWGPMNTLLCDYKLVNIPHDNFYFLCFLPCLLIHSKWLEVI